MPEVWPAPVAITTIWSAWDMVVAALKSVGSVGAAVMRRPLARPAFWVKGRLWPRLPVSGTGLVEAGATMVTFEVRVTGAGASSSENALPEMTMWSIWLDWLRIMNALPVGMTSLLTVLPPRTQLPEKNQAPACVLPLGDCRRMVVEFEEAAEARPDSLFGPKVCAIVPLPPAAVPAMLR